MTRSRPARSARPILACLLVSALAACGGSPQRAAMHTPAIASEWPRPDGYDRPGSSSDPWGPYIQQAARRFDVPERWIREVMRQESGGRQSVTSHAGAMGLMQVMPGTYAELSRRYGLGGDPYHPWDNIMAGTAYLREMYELYGAPGFLAAYNAGPRRLEDYLWAGRGLPAETRNYVARIGPRIADTHPNRRAAPEIYAAAEIPLRIPPGPRRGDTATMLALRDQRNAVDPGIRVAQLPPGPVVRMDPIPDGSTTPAPVQLAAMGGPVVAMAPVASLGDFQRRMEPIASAGDFQRRMEPISSPGDPGTVVASPLAPPPAARPSRGFSLIPSAQAGTLPVPVRAATAAPAGGGAWGVQVGAFASANLARAAADRASGLVGARGTRVVVEPVRQGRGTLYRARVVGLSSRAAADQACDRLRGRGACMIVAPGV
ncbi:MAG TPA: lytic transglycosylase domain-containing protein [Falsiroseomonas sp.]|jgi:cell division septation protein DedD|nr:lytic transglycosylase domain-containing protein [Falsiroseomonas sp.]